MNDQGKESLKQARVFSGAPWESVIGYCRALRRDSFIFVTGTAAVNSDGEIVSKGLPREQTKFCLEKIEDALQQLGATRRDIVRTRMYVTDIGMWEDFGAAHFAFFGSDVPATSMVQVAALIDPEMLIEIEADAIAAD